MTPFEILNDAIGLLAQGRENAAQAQWQSLPADFRVRMLKFIIGCTEMADQIQTVPDTTLATPYGILELSTTKIMVLMSAVRMLSG